MNRHKHAEVLIAIAEGNEAEFKMENINEWQRSIYINPISNPELKWRVVPESVPQWRKDLAQALDDGKVVETVVFEMDEWMKSNLAKENLLDPSLDLTKQNWRIKPEKVPQWRKDLAQALEDGKVVEFKGCDGWEKSNSTKEDFLNPNVSRAKELYRIKPEEPVKQTLYIYNNNLNCTSFITHQPPDRVTMIDGLEYMGSIEVTK